MSSLQCQRKISQRAFEGKLREFHMGEQNIIRMIYLYIYVFF